MKLTRITSIPLRTKLSAAIAIPIVGLIGLGAGQVQSLTAEVSATEAQLTVVESNVTLADVAAAIRTERDVQLTVISLASPLNRSEDGSNSYYDRVRGDTDGVFSAALSDPALTRSDRSDIEAIESRLAEARLALGSDPHEMRDALLAELVAGTSGEGTISAALDTFDQIVSDTIQLVGVEASSELDSQTALDLTTLQLSSAFDEAIRLEALSYLKLSLLAPEEQLESQVAAARARGAESVQLERVVREVGSPEFAPSFDQLIDGSRYQAFLDLRDHVSGQDVGEITVPRNTVFFVLLALTNNLNDIKDEIAETASATATTSNDDAERQLWLGGAALAGLLGMVAILTVTLVRSIRRPLLTLTERSRAISDVELPGVVKLLREEGLTADVPEIVPIEAQTKDEVGELVHAFNDMHRTAVDLASEQAASRRTVAEMFVNLGRRNQRLLMRILDYLDGLEANEEDPETLERLFKIDHLATRMRRNAESLLVLAGAREARVFHEPVEIADVVRSALGEVEGYERVDLDIRTEKLIDGSAVADSAHLLAELIENSLAFSPPSSRVTVSAADSPKGFVVAVSDAGIGMTPAAIEAANETIQRAMSLEETPSKDLGHHVVGRLAGRHGVQVELREGITDGLVAKVTMPAELISDPSDGTDLAVDSSVSDPIELSVEEEDGSLAILFSGTDDMEAAERRHRAAAESLELVVEPEAEPDISLDDVPAITAMNIETVEPDAAAWSDPAPVSEEVTLDLADTADSSQPMSVAEASRIARSERAAEAAAESVPAEATPSVLETTSGFALAKRRRKDDEPAMPVNPLGVKRSPGANLPIGVKPTMDVSDVDVDLVDPVRDEGVSSSGADPDTRSRFAASLASFQSGIQRAASSNDNNEESS